MRALYEYVCEARDTYGKRLVGIRAGQEFAYHFESLPEYAVAADPATLAVESPDWRGAVAGVPIYFTEERFTLEPMLNQ